MTGAVDATRARPRGRRPHFEWARTALSCALLAAFGVWIRSLQRGFVLTPAGVLPIDGDSFYHFRRIVYTVRNFPAFLGVDPYLNFPHGGEPIWSPLFDFASAVLVRAVMGDAGQAAIERFLCWIPPVLGGLHVALIFLLGRRFLSTPAAVAAALLLAVLPAHVSYAQFGFVDHHVAVSLAGSLVLFAAMAFAARPGRREAVWLGVALAGALLLWPGCLIHVGVAQAALLGFCLSRSQPGEATAVARRLAATHALAAVAVAPFCLGRTWVRWGAISPLVLSNFQPLWLAAGAVSFRLLAEVWLRIGFPRERWRRAASAAAVGAGVAVLVLAALPGLATTGAADAFAWLTRGEEFQAVVKESQPLLVRHGQLFLGRGLVLLSAGMFLAPVAIAALVLRARWERRADLGILAAWSAAFLLLALAQWRFAVDAAPALALLLPSAVEGAAAAAPPRRRRLLAGAAAAVGIALCLPVLVWYQTRPVADRVRARKMLLTVTAARWLGEHSPRTSGWIAPGPPPEYGVLVPWGSGHAIRYVAERPVVQDNFGDDVGREGFEAAEAYFSAESEPDALRILEALRVRYVLVDPTGSGHGRGYGPASMYARLRRSDEGLDRTATEAFGSPARHRLLYESGPLDPRGGEPQWKLFEVVPGAHLVGRADPGTAVEAELQLHSRRGRRFRFLARAVADAAGRYTVVLPYPTGTTGDVAAAPRYELRGGEGKASVSISEEQVERGEDVPGPTLIASRRAAPPRPAPP